MELRPISSCGRKCNLCLGVLIVLFTALTFSTNWWIVYFWDCDNFDDEAYYILLDKGLCRDSKTGQEGNYDDCTSWQDLADAEELGSDAGDGAEQYMDADGLCKSALAFAVAIFVTVILQFSPQVSKLSIVRIIQAIMLVLCAVLILAAIGRSTETFYTDVGNYTARASCDSNTSSAYTGYIFALFASILTSSMALCILFPCMDCIDTTYREPDPNTVSAMSRVIEGPSVEVRAARPAEGSGNPDHPKEEKNNI